ETVAGEELPGVVGCVPEVEEFAGQWAEHTGARTRTHMRQGVYALEHVDPPAPVPGSVRIAGADDQELVLRWWLAFGDEVLHEGGPGRENAASMVDPPLPPPLAPGPPSVGHGA